MTTVTLLSVLAACGGSDDATPPAAPAGLTIGGAPMTVQVVQVPEANAETGAQSIPLTIASAGTYQCTAHAQQGAEQLDAQMAFVQGAAELTRDSDSGEGVDSMIVRELTPGAYTVRVWEWRGRAAAINVSCAIAPPAPPVVPLTFGTPVTVQVAAGAGPVARPTLTFTVAAAGNYRCHAGAAGMDAQMSIMLNGVEIASDSDSGGNFDAQIDRALTPGTYTIAVWEFQQRATPVVVRCDPAAAAAAPLALGTPAQVTVAAGETAQAELDLNVTSPGNYRCTAHADQAGQGLDAELSILLAGTQVGMDRDSGGNMDAALTQTLAPGAYKVRVWEFQRRPATITVTCGLAPPA